MSERSGIRLTQARREEIRSRIVVIEQAFGGTMDGLLNDLRDALEDIIHYQVMLIAIRDAYPEPHPGILEKARYAPVAHAFAKMALDDDDSGRREGTA